MSAPVSVESLQDLLSYWFAPWVQALVLRVESFADGEVTLRLPQSDQLSRVGGMLSGQDARITARVIRAGKSRVFGEIDITGAHDGRSVCRASTTCALL